MAIREVRKIGDPCLEKVCKEVKAVSPRTNELIDDMFDTMYESCGVGLAAPQVGILKRIVVIDVEDDHGPIVLINPVITKRDGEQTGYEGCLSVPGKSGIVTRAENVTVEAFDRNMEKFTLDAEGLLARCIQHECDHLDGVLYTTKVEGDLLDNSQLEEMYED